MAAALLAVHSGVIAVTILQTGRVSPYAQQGITAFAPHLVSFAALTVLVLTIKQTLWRIGGILAALSALMRSALTSFPEHIPLFASSTIIVSALSLLAVLASWRVGPSELARSDQAAARHALRPALALFFILAITAIFLYWGRH